MVFLKPADEALQFCGADIAKVNLKCPAESPSLICGLVS